jgi:hypothetical protein
MIAGALLVVAAVAFGFCHRPAPTPLPAALDQQVTQHEVATAVDTAEVHRLKDVAARSQAAQRADSVRAATLERSVAVERHRADSLAAEAVRATTAHDSAARFEAAYDARSAEADTLRAEIVVKDATISHATARGDSLLAALTITERRATRADSVIAAAVKVVHASDPPCTFAHFFHCPSRTETAVYTVGAIVVADVGYRLVRAALSHAAPVAVPVSVGSPIIVR